MSAGTWAEVALVGGAGAVARFVVDGTVAGRANGSFPAGTLVVNLSGSLLLGLITGLALHGNALLIAGTGLLGGYTTFSTWMLESHRLGEEGRTGLLWVNLLLSLVLGLGAAALGRALGSRL